MKKIETLINNYGCSKIVTSHTDGEIRTIHFQSYRATKCPEFSWLARKNHTGPEARKYFSKPRIFKIKYNVLNFMPFLPFLTKIWLKGGQSNNQNCTF